MRRNWGTTQNFFLAFTDELKKQIFIKKLLKWANKKQNNFNIYNAAFFFKKTPGDIIILHLCTKNLDDMIYRSSNLERDRLILVILGHFLPFYPPPKKSKF